MDDIQAMQQLNEKEGQLIQAVTKHNNLIKQKMKSVWVSEADRNSKFMHDMYQGKVNRCLIMELQPEEGLILSDQESIRKELSDTFRRRFQLRPVDTDGQLLANLRVVFNDERNAMMSECPSEHEIEEVVLSMSASSLPGPDGFSGAFFIIVGPL